MTTWVTKDGEYKNVQTEDLSYYTQKGWTESEAPVVETLQKKGRRRAFDEVEVSENTEVEE